MNPKLSRGITVSGAFLIAAVVGACSFSLPMATPAMPGVDPTKVALELQGTAMALQLTQVAMSAGQSQATAAPSATPLPPTDTPAPQATATPDIEAMIKGAKVLVYENTDERFNTSGMWVQAALDRMGLQYTQTGSYSGRFMAELNSGAQYDLIIVDAEDKDRISGEFWDAIGTRLNRDKAGLIVELWYLERESRGPISNLLSQCGVAYYKDLNIDDTIYLWHPEHPVLTQPNIIPGFISTAMKVPFWKANAGDLIRLTGTGDATLLAGLHSTKAGINDSVLASCLGGRMILQTFSDHDYKQADIINLWQNYIYNTLKSHFVALQ